VGDFYRERDCGTICLNKTFPKSGRSILVLWGKLGPFLDPFHYDAPIGQEHFNLVAVALADVERAHKVEVSKQPVNVCLHK
jgi:hypothetical protein